MHTVIIINTYDTCMHISNLHSTRLHVHCTIGINVKLYYTTIDGMVVYIILIRGLIF